MFELFERLNRPGSGAGVGLAVTKRIIELHGGRIWVESEGAGKGATFTFSLEQTRLQ
ncbi:MAG: ATP-binding protein [Planctomycetota bacterium]|nr:ATP-binding protein [Planctomycetota bacterium]